MRVLITGITGFVGSHLLDLLAGQGEDVQIWGMRRWRSQVDELGANLARVRLLDGDLLDPASLRRVVDMSQPDVIYHLAASSSVAASWDTPNEVLQINVAGTLHLLEAVRQLPVDPVVVLACSAEAYGDVGVSPIAVREDHPFRPLSPYAVSKAAVDLLGYQYFRSHRVRTVRLRLFNHAGPRQSDRFVVSSFARQIAEIEAGRRAPRIAVGNLEARRDFIDVRDVVRAYVVAAGAEAGAVFNVCTGTARSIREVLDALLDMAGRPIEVEQDPARLRAAEVPVLVGDPSALTAATGWRPEVPFEATLRDALDAWRTELGVSV